MNYLYMKSLAESLFDDDLVTKKFRIRDVYKLLENSRGIFASGFPISAMFDSNKVNEYPNPYHGSSLESVSIEHLIGIIADQEIPDLDNSSRIEKWCKDLKKTLSKYIKRSWKKEWDDKVNISLTYHTKYYLGICIEFGHGDGELEFVFTTVDSNSLISKLKYNKR